MPADPSINTAAAQFAGGLRLTVSLLGEPRKTRRMRMPRIDAAALFETPAGAAEIRFFIDLYRKPDGYGGMAPGFRYGLPTPFIWEFHGPEGEKLFKAGFSTTLRRDIYARAEILDSIAKMKTLQGKATDATTEIDKLLKEILRTKPCI